MLKEVRLKLILVWILISHPVLLNVVLFSVLLHTFSDIAFLFIHIS